MKVAPAYMTIRDYIVSYFYKTGDTPEKILSENELCRLFNVSRVTARAALKGLVDEGYLITRRGMGTFTNPEKRRYRGSPGRLIGVIVGGGQHVAFDYFTGKTLSGILGRAPEKNARVSLINIFSSDPLARANELATTRIDGFIWIRPRPPDYPVIAELGKRNMPVVVVEALRSEDFHAVASDWEDLGYRSGETLTRWGRHRAAFVGANMFPDAWRGFSRAFADARLGAPLGVPFEWEAPAASWRDALANPDLDAVWMAEGGFFPTWDFLKETGRLASLALVVKREVCFDPSGHFPRIEVLFPYRRLGAFAVERLVNLIEGKADGPRLQTLKATLKTYEREGGKTP